MTPTLAWERRLCSEAGVSGGEEGRGGEGRRREERRGGEEAVAVRKEGKDSGGVEGRGMAVRWGMRVKEGSQG